MKTHAKTLALTLILAPTLAMATWVAGCSGPNTEMEAAEAMPSTEEATEDAAASSSPVEREFWLALAEEPGWHLEVAQEDFRRGQKLEASQELEKVAAILNFESRHAHSARERGLLLASVQELREVARGLRVDEKPGVPEASMAELDRVAALAFRAIAAHQVTLGRDALEAGDARAAGLYIEETAAAVINGFDRSGIERSPSLDESLEAARRIGDRLKQDGEGSRQEGLEALDHLDQAVGELTEVLTNDRK